MLTKEDQELLLKGANDLIALVNELRAINPRLPARTQELIESVLLSSGFAHGLVYRLDRELREIHTTP
jgi:hypothetical protein